MYYTFSPRDTLFSLAQRFSVSTDLLFGINSQIANPDFISTNQVIRVPAFIYAVAAGDSLSRISSQMELSMDKIIKSNERKAGFSPDVLYIGYLLLLPLPLPASPNILVLRPLPGEEIQKGRFLQGMARAF